MEVENDFSEIRKKGCKVLSTKLAKENNIKIIEDLIFNNCENDEKRYNRILFQVMGNISKQNAVYAFKTIKNKKIEWNDEVYEKISKKIKEFNEYLVAPFEVIEGVVKCHSCGSKKTICSTMQTRSSDEQMTLFVRCTQCGKHWCNNG